MSHFTLEFVSETAGSLPRIFRSMLEVEHSFGLRNLYSVRFTESEICLLLFEYETQTEHKKLTQICLVTASEFSVYWAQNLELSTNPCSRFLYSLGPCSFRQQLDFSRNHSAMPQLLREYYSLTFQPLPCTHLIQLSELGHQIYARGIFENSPYARIRH